MSAPKATTVTTVPTSMAKVIKEDIIASKRPHLTERD